MPNNVHVPYSTWFAYGVGHIFNDLCASMWFTYFLIFYVYVLQFDNKLAGTALFIGQVADGISTTLVGILSDRGRSSHWIYKYGKRKTWHLLGTMCVFTTFPFIYSPYMGFKTLNYQEQLAYYAVFIIIFQFGWASTQISHLSLAPELTSDEHGRTSLLTVRYSFTVLSNIAVYMIFWFVIRVHRVGEDTVIGPADMTKFQTVACIVVLIGLVMSSIFHAGVTEREHSDDEHEQLVEASESRVSILKSPRILNGACVYMATRLFVNLSQIYIPLYLHSYLKLPSENLAVLPLIMFMSSYVTSFIIKPLNVEFGRKFAYVCGALMGMGACVWVKLGKDYYYQTYEIYGVVIAFGCASSIILVTSLGITADLIGNNTINGAFVYGVMSFCDKVSNGVAVMIIEHIKNVGDSYGYYRDVLTYSCGGAAIFGLLFVLAVKPANYENFTNESSIQETESTCDQPNSNVPNSVESL